MLESLNKHGKINTFVLNQIFKDNSKAGLTLTYIPPIGGYMKGMSSRLVALIHFSLNRG